MCACVPDRSQNTAAAEESEEEEEEEEEEPSQMSGGCDGMGLPPSRIIVIVWAPNAWNKGGLLFAVVMHTDRVAISDA